MKITEILDKVYAVGWSGKIADERENALDQASKAEACPMKYGNQSKVCNCNKQTRHPQYLKALSDLKKRIRG